MTTFAIQIEPSLPPDAAPAPRSLDGVDWFNIGLKHLQEYNVRYLVDAAVFSYYPSNIVTAINDVHIGWTGARERQSCILSLSGYEVLGLDFSGEIAHFYDLIELPGQTQKRFVGEQIAAASVENVFATTMARLWHVVEALGR